MQTYGFSAKNANKTGLYIIFPPVAMSSDVMSHMRIAKTVKDKSEIQELPKLACRQDTTPHVRQSSMTKPAQ